MTAPVHAPDPDRPLSLVIVGASGDLARRKLLPALFALYGQGYLPSRFTVFGFARTPMTDEQFRQAAMENLSCRYSPGESCAPRMAEFLARCRYAHGRYESADDFAALARVMQAEEGAAGANRLYYFSIPPSVFVHVARSIGRAGLVGRDPGLSRSERDRPWSRVVIEKPFGTDRESSDMMAKELGEVFAEDQVYRIDHYLGKEIIQNLMVLRFANSVFEPIWSRAHIEHVRITWKEDLGIGSRGGYFDGIGILRDVMQNHLLQILSLVAMEDPASMESKAVRDEKVRVLKSIAPAGLENLVVGQYRGVTRNGIRLPSYLEEAHVAPGSITPTFAAAVLRVRNDRWGGVPFFLTAGKALDSRMNEIRVRFRDPPRNIFAATLPDLPNNELVIRIQPDEAIFYRIVNKEPGLKLSLVETDLNLRYQSAFREPIPEAYECLLLDAIRGDKSLFIRSDELAAAWDVFTPVLHELEKQRIRPQPYDFGSQGPDSARELAARNGVVLP